MDIKPINEPSSVETEQSTSTIYNKPVYSPVSLNTTGVVDMPKTDKIKKDKHIWLWVMISVIIIVFPITSYFLIKDNADKVATSYTVSLKSYLIKVYDEVNSSTASPISVENLILKSKKPQLPATPLSSLSSKYKSAQLLVTDSNTKLSDFDKQITDFTVVYNYQKASGDLVAKDIIARQSLGNNLNSLTNSLNIIKQVKALADSVKAPSELKPDFIDISKNINDMITAYTSVIAAYKTGDQTAFKIANDNFTAISRVESEAERKSFTAYYSGILSKLVISVKDLKIYANSIK